MQLLQCRTTTLTSIFTNASVGSQWFKDGLPIPGATNASYTISNATFADAGSYIFRSTNALAVCEQVFQVVITADDVPLEVLQAVGWLNLTNVLVQFTLPLDETSAEDVFNYALGSLEVLTATLRSNLHEVLLTTEPRQPGQVYQLEVGNIHAPPGACPGGSLNYQAIRLDLEQEVLPFHSKWKYDQSGSDLGAAWYAPQYNDSSWPSGTGLLGREAGSGLELLEAQGLRLNTQLDLLGTTGTEIISYYFRRVVNVSFVPTNTTFTLRHVVDDGAVFYVNGTEAGRFNMPPGVIAYNTFAPTSPEEGVIHSVNLPGFVRGTNVIAVEVHKRSVPDGDVLFGAQVIGVASGAAAPRLAVRRTDDGTLTLSWQGQAILQESASSLEWQDSANQTNPQTLSPLLSSRFYRLRQ